MRNEVKSGESDGYALLPCPFCGTEARFNDCSRWIRCQNDKCGASLIGPDYHYQSSADTWNRRHNAKAEGAK